MTVERITDDLPVDEIFGVQDGQSGNAVEAARRQVIVVTNGDGVGITIIGEEYGIFVHAVAQVRIPDFGVVLCWDRNQSHTGTEQECEKESFLFHRLINLGSFCKQDNLVAIVCLLY